MFHLTPTVMKTFLKNFPNSDELQYRTLIVSYFVVLIIVVAISKFH